MIFTYKKANISDLDNLIKTRIEVLRAANELSDEADMSLVEQETAYYYKNCFTNDNHVAYLVYHNDLLIFEAKQRGIIKITLEATQSGKPLYERYGFTTLEDEMIYP